MAVASGISAGPAIGGLLYAVRKALKHLIILPWHFQIWFHNNVIGIFQSFDFEAPLLFLSSLCTLTLILSFIFLHPINVHLPGSYSFRLCIHAYAPHNPDMISFWKDAAEDSLQLIANFEEPTDSFVLGLKTMFRSPGIFVPLSVGIIMFMNVSFFDVALSPFIHKKVRMAYYNSILLIRDVVLLVEINSARIYPYKKINYFLMIK